MQTQPAEGEIFSLNLTPEGLRLSTASCGRGPTCGDALRRRRAYGRLPFTLLEEIRRKFIVAIRGARRAAGSFDNNLRDIYHIVV
jgi:hypothetical protein